MGNMADGLNMLPRIGEPESALEPGMAAPAPELTAGRLPRPGALSMVDTSGPGPTALQEPAAWTYDFNPASGSSRASFNGEVQFTSGGPGGPIVTTFNTRTGTVTLTGADITGAGGALASSLAAFLPLAGGVLTGALTPAQPAGIVGTTAANNAAAGSVGEFVSANAAGGSVPLTTAVAANITSISLTAGDWDVDGNSNFAFSAASAVTVIAAISATSATLPPGVFQGSLQGSTLTNATLPTGTTRFSLAATTTIFLVGFASFAGVTCNGGGFIRARRVR
jgi:hypothetical protein